MKMGSGCFKPWLAVGGLALLAACSGSPPTVYHTLGGVGESASPDVAVSRRIPTLGVGPVKLPSLLDRQGIVLRKDLYTIDVSEFHLWGGQLEDEFTEALTGRLQARLPQTRLQNIPWELEQTPKYQFTLHISQFDGMPDGMAILKGSWGLQQASTGKLVKSGLIRLEDKVAGKDVEAIVRAQGRLLDRLAGQLVAALP